jgi:hypothetical protein
MEFSKEEVNNIYLLQKEKCELQDKINIITDKIDSYNKYVDNKRNYFICNINRLNNFNTMSFNDALKRYLISNIDNIYISKIQYNLSNPLPHIKEYDENKFYELHEDKNYKLDKCTINDLNSPMNFNIDASDTYYIVEICNLLKSIIDMDRMEYHKVMSQFKINGNFILN